VQVALQDQPEDIEDQVRTLILKYIDNPRAIILAVSPANADIATSESIKIAKKVDPQGNRTLGVVTKLDLMDKGTNATNVLEDKTIIKLGMIGVVNRSQQDLNDKKSMAEALKYERGFIADNYPQLKDRIGSAYLAKRLNCLLMGHIDKCLPDLQVIRKNDF
jgi:dynamin 1-like protein